MHTLIKRLGALFIFLFFIPPALKAPVADNSWKSKVAPALLQEASAGQVEFLIELSEQADLSGAAALESKEEKGVYVFQRLRETAQRSQAGLVSALRDSSVPFRPYWIVNVVWARGDGSTLASLAKRPEVKRISANPKVRFHWPEQISKAQSMPRAPGSPSNIQQVGAPLVWEAGFTGQGIVVAGADTGYDWDHPALEAHYRGWDGVGADHNYNWHDAIHEDWGTPNLCGVDSPAPCDDSGHGTHTMGTIVGDDGAGNQIGMAPGATWIGCRNMEQGIGTPARYIECFEWFLAPTDLNNQNPDPTRAPDIINNSWGCTLSEGCGPATWQILKETVQHVRAAGILNVASAGNSGRSGCGSVDDPPAIYEEMFSVGAVDSSDAIADFSSRGPADYTNLLKPNIVAPGVDILSSIKGGGYGMMRGTSTAAPHAAGLAALLLSARPDLRGNVEALETIIELSAVHLASSEDCGGTPGSGVPNNTYGWGRIDAWKALTILVGEHRIYLPYLKNQ